MKNKLETIRKALMKIPHLSYCMAIGLSISLLLNSFVCQAVRVSGSSMEPSYHDGDRLVMEKISYRVGKPERFDVVVFPRNGDYYLIKRIIGLPGETVHISQDGNILIDGRTLEEDYGLEKISNAGIAENDIMLGDGEYFVLGDNRNNSADSRNSAIGNVGRNEILGRIIW